MRSDETRDKTFVDATAWSQQKYKDALFIRQSEGPPFFKNNSFSGHEPNHLFLNDGHKFHNLTLVSGADHDGDGRGFAILDFDKDGWQDIALVSTNFPRFKLLRNQLGDLQSGDFKATSRLVIAVKGSNLDSTPNTETSCRDAIGAKILAIYRSGRRQIQQKQVGTGNVAQNSELIWFGQTDDDPIVRIDVTWPSGKSVSIDQFDSDQPIEVLEPKN